MHACVLPRLLDLRSINVHAATEDNDFDRAQQMAQDELTYGSWLMLPQSATPWDYQAQAGSYQGIAYRGDCAAVCRAPSARQRRTPVPSHERRVRRTRRPLAVTTLRATR